MKIVHAIGYQERSDWIRSGVKSHREAVDLRAYVYVALMVVLGSTTAAAAKFAVAELPVTLVPAVRFGMAGLCLIAVALGPWWSAYG